MNSDGSGRSENLVKLAKRLRQENSNRNFDANVSGGDSKVNESAAEPVPREGIKPNRAAVLICLFEDEKGDLRVILTRRSSKLSSHSGKMLHFYGLEFSVLVNVEILCFFLLDNIFQVKLLCLEGKGMKMMVMMLLRR